MNALQGAPGRSNSLLLVIVFLFCASTIGFVLFEKNQNQNQAAVQQPPVTNSTVTVPVTVPVTPSVTVTIPASCPRSGDAAYVPRPIIKRVQDAFLEKLKRHEVKLNKVWPWFMYETTYECTMGEDRIGFTGEGGKWICGVFNLLQKPNCVIYSLGSNGQHDFEDDVIAYTNCEIHTFDMADYSNVFNNSRVHFHTSKIGDGTNDTKSISQWMKELGHKHLDVLKIDIEGSEIDAIAELASHYNPPWIGQILIEFHVLNSPDWTKMDQKAKYKFVDGHLRLIENLNKLGCVQFHREDNPGSHRGCEYSYGNLRPRPQV